MFYSRFFCYSESSISENASSSTSSVPRTVARSPSETTRTPCTAYCMTSLSIVCSSASDVFLFAHLILSGMAVPSSTIARYTSGAKEATCVFHRYISFSADAEGLHQALILSVSWGTSPEPLKTPKYAWSASRSIFVCAPAVVYKVSPSGYLFPLSVYLRESADARPEDDIYSVLTSETILVKH